MYKLYLEQCVDNVLLKMEINRSQFEKKNIHFFAFEKRRCSIEEGRLLDTKFQKEDKNYFASCECNASDDIKAVAAGIVLESGKKYKMAEVYRANGWIQDASVVPYPRRMIGFSLTNQCNLNCEMCWQVDRTRKLYASYEMISKTLENIKALGNPPIYMWGGEPFLHTDIAKIIKKIHDLGLFSIINTNGTLLFNCVDKIIECMPDMIIISIDGTEAVHDKVRNQKGAYQRIIEGIKKLNSIKKTKPLIAINCVITEDNYKILPEIEQLRNEINGSFLEYQLMMFYSEEEKAIHKRRIKEEFGVDATSIDGYPTSMGNVDFNELWKTLEEVTSKSKNRARVFPYKVKTFENLDDYIYHPNKVCDRHCENISSAMWIEADGTVYPCSNFTDVGVGNVYTSDALDIWNNNSFLDFGDKLNNHLLPICSRCCDMYKTDLFQAGN